ANLIYNATDTWRHRHQATTIAVTPRSSVVGFTCTDLHAPPSLFRLKRLASKGNLRTAMLASKHHETELCSPHYRLSPAVRTEFGKNAGDVKLDGVDGDSQPARDHLVRGAVCHRCKHFQFPRRQPCVGAVNSVH